MRKLRNSKTSRAGSCGSRGRRGRLALSAALFLLLACGARPAPAQTVNFNFFAAPTFVANTGSSEVLGEVVLTANITCGTSADGFCISTAGSIQITYSGMVADNDIATGIQVCEVIAAVTTCNAAGTYLTGAVSSGSSPQGAVVTFGVKTGANLAAGDQVRVSGLRARIDETTLATSGNAALAFVTASPVSVAGIAPTAQTIARSADPLSITLVGDPLVPCLVSDPAAVLEVAEEFPTAFVDHGDPSEKTYPGPPANARPAFGAINNTHITLVLAGLVPDITVKWPASVPALLGTAVLDLISQSTDGSLATYAYSTADQGNSDAIQERFDITLTSANFIFSGNGSITGDVKVQGQLSPPATPTTARPRYNHPLEPVPGLFFLALRRCNNLTGTLTLRAQVDGIGWNGGLSYQLSGPTPISGNTVSVILEGMLAGTYTLNYISGGPSAATFTGYSPSQDQTLNVFGSRLFTFNFTGPTIANLALTSAPIPVCPAASTTVGTFQLVNSTADMQIIPGGATFNFTFSSPIAAAPTITDLGLVNPTLAGATMSFEIPGSISVQPGGVLTFTGTKLNLAALGNAQNVTVQFTTVPASAIHLTNNQAPLATTSTALCAPPPPPPPPVPAFTAANVTNGASFLTGLSAGSISTVFGTNLSNSTGIVQSNGLPLPRQLAGVTLTVSGIQAPIYSLANANGQEQINFQVPWEVALLANPLAPTIVVNNNGLANSPVSVNLLAAFPGIFTTDGTAGAILHGIGSALVTSASPASPGEVVVLFATGLGTVSANPGTGNPALGNPPSLTPVNPTVTVGGLAATVQFSGLAPGFVGLYQVNIQLPANVPSGSQDVVVQIAGQSSKAVKIAIR